MVYNNIKFRQTLRAFKHYTGNIQQGLGLLWQTMQNKSGIYRSLGTDLNSTMHNGHEEITVATLSFVSSLTGIFDYFWYTVKHNNNFTSLD